MLVLSRKSEQQIVIGDQIKITVLSVKGNTVKIGVEAPEHVRVLRSEIIGRPPKDKSAAETVAAPSVASLQTASKPVRNHTECAAVDPFAGRVADARPSAPVSRSGQGPVTDASPSAARLGSMAERVRQLRQAGLRLDARLSAAV